MRVALLLVAAAASLLQGCVNACTSASYADPSTGDVASYRHLDLPNSYFNQIAWVPKGFKVSAIPVASNGTHRSYSSLGDSYLVRYSFVCFVATRTVMEAWIDKLVPGSGLNKATSPGSCSDGLNTAGLAVGGQMQPDSTGINVYKGSGPAVEQLDFITYLLATYSTASAIKADLVSGRLNPVLNPALSTITQTMFTTNYSTLHYVIYDKLNKSLVIEYSGPNNLQWWDNELGVLANNPLYQDQVQFYQAYSKKAANETYITIHDSNFYQMPGAFNSSYRFTKAAMLKQPAMLWSWPKRIRISPSVVAPGVPKTNPNMMTVIIMARNLWLPMGIDDSGGEQGVGMNPTRDITWWTSLRDHANLILYFQVANDPQWKRINLKTTAWSTMRGIKYADMTPGKWWTDQHYDGCKL